mmetsp:Transcript_28096/g.39657  ORF Transcript_28096/g.39657 Transcript_28096/m.39657 type:complete len:189 (-) Transcript_28096:1174-1740(-)
MGNTFGSLTPEEIEQIKASSNFSERDLKRLYRRFKKLDADGSGTLTTDEFLNIPELAMNPLLERVIQIFDTNGNNQIEFVEFISGLSIFSQKGNKEKKLRFAFSVYDIDGDGFISNGELFLVLKMMVGNNLTDTQLQQIVDKSILEADTDKDGKISFEEFVKIIGNSTDDVDNKLTFNFDDHPNNNNE